MKQHFCFRFRLETFVRGKHWISCVSPALDDVSWCGWPVRSDSVGTLRKVQPQYVVLASPLGQCVGVYLRAYVEFALRAAV